MSKTFYTSPEDLEFKGSKPSAGNKYSMSFSVYLSCVNYSLCHSEPQDLIQRRIIPQFLHLKGILYTLLLLNFWNTPSMKFEEISWREKTGSIKKIYLYSRMIYYPR